MLDGGTVELVAGVILSTLILCTLVDGKGCVGSGDSGLVQSGGVKGGVARDGASKLLGEISVRWGGVGNPVTNVVQIIIDCVLAMVGVRLLGLVLFKVWLGWGGDRGDIIRLFGDEGGWEDGGFSSEGKVKLVAGDDVWAEGVVVAEVSRCGRVELVAGANVARERMGSSMAVWARMGWVCWRGSGVWSGLDGGWGGGGGWGCLRGSCG